MYFGVDVFGIASVGVISALALYMVTMLLVIWVPATADESQTRKETVVIANAMMASIAATFIVARGFSWVGEKLVDLPFLVLNNMYLHSGTTAQTSSANATRWWGSRSTNGYNSNLGNTPATTDPGSFKNTKGVGGEESVPLTAHEQRGRTFLSGM